MKQWQFVRPKKCRNKFFDFAAPCRRSSFLNFSHHRRCEENSLRSRERAQPRIFNNIETYGVPGSWGPVYSLPFLLERATRYENDDFRRIS